ncbi:MAG: hypothetical protein ACK4K9_06630 [Bacteroidia bacterium]
MITCGYVCPQCEGKGFLEDLSECNYCKPNTEQTTTTENNVEPT